VQRHTYVRVVVRWVI